LLRPASVPLRAQPWGVAGETAAAPSGFANFGNAQDTVNALQAKGYNVIINGGQAFPLSSCKVLGVED